MTKTEILQKLLALYNDFEPDDCINWGEQALMEIEDILDKEGIIKL